MPIYVIDIHPDGSTQAPEDKTLLGQGTYRWWHFDRSDPTLAAWADDVLPDIPAAALMQSETRPRCDRFQDGLILNLRGINMNEGQSADQMVSLRMWVARGVVITVRVRRVFALEDIRQAMLDGAPPLSVGAFLDMLIGKLTLRVQEEVLRIGEATDRFEDAVADGTPAVPQGLSDQRRSVIKLRRYLEPQRTALQKLATIDIRFLTNEDRLELRELANRSMLAVEELEALQDRLIGVQDFCDSQTALRQSKNGYALSVVAAIFLPLGFLTGLFGVNVAGMPGTETTWAFAALSLCMIVSALVMIAVMRWMRWL